MNWVSEGVPALRYKQIVVCHSKDHINAATAVTTQIVNTNINTKCKTT